MISGCVQRSGRSARSVLSGVAVLLLLVPLVACGGDDADDSGDSAQPTATAATDATSSPGTFTTAELEQFGRDLIVAIAEGDREALTALVKDIVPQERIDEIAACKPDDLTIDDGNVSVVIEPPTMRIGGTVDVTSDGNTVTRGVSWNTELSEVSSGVYVLSALPSGCPFIFQ